MVNPIIPADYSAVQQQQESQRRGGSKAKSALASGVVMGSVGAAFGATAFAPKSIDSPSALLGLTQDTFQKNLKVPEKAKPDVKAAQDFLLNTRNEIETVQAENFKKVEALFPNQISEVSLNDVLKQHYPQYSSLADIDAKLENLKLQSEASAKLVKDLQAKEGKSITRTELSKILEQNGVANPEELAKNSIPSRWKFWKSRNLKTDAVLQKITKNPKMNATKFQAVPELMTADLNEFLEVLKNPKNLKNGNFTKEAYMGYVESKNAVPKVGDKAQEAFGLVKKYITKNRGQGAVKVGTIATGIGVLVGLFMGGSKKD